MMTEKEKAELEKRINDQQDSEFIKFIIFTIFAIPISLFLMAVMANMWE